MRLRGIAYACLLVALVGGLEVWLGVDVRLWEYAALFLLMVVAHQLDHICGAVLDRWYGRKDRQEAEDAAGRRREYLGEAKWTDER